MYQQDDRRGGDLRHHDQVALRVVGQILEQKLVDQQRGAERDRQGVSVGRRFGHHVGSMSPDRPSLVVDDDDLAQSRPHFLGQQRARHAGGSTGGEGHDELDRLGGQGLRLGDQTKGHGDRRQLPTDGAVDEGVLYGCLSHGWITYGPTFRPSEFLS